MHYSPGIDLLQALGYYSRDRDEVARVGLDMRVALGVQVPLGPVECDRYFQPIHEITGHQVAWI
jgi:hypothetical protein